MPSIRVSSNHRNVHDMEWIGAAEVDAQGRIARTLDVPEEAYARLEAAIQEGAYEGNVYLSGGARVHWFLDR